MEFLESQAGFNLRAWFPSALQHKQHTDTERGSGVKPAQQWWNTHKSSLQPRKASTDSPLAHRGSYRGWSNTKLQLLLCITLLLQTKHERVGAFYNQSLIGNEPFIFNHSLWTSTSWSQFVFPSLCSASWESELLSYHFILREKRIQVFSRRPGFIGLCQSYSSKPGIKVEMRNGGPMGCFPVCCSSD